LQKLVTLLVSVTLLMGMLMVPVSAETLTENDVLVKPYSVYRLYNPNTGEHFYTTEDLEWGVLIDAGREDEYIGWYAPITGDPVCRLYNPNAGDHPHIENNS
jgi:hypothetical protein